MGPVRSRYSGATGMASSGIPVWIDVVPRTVHAKLVVIDAHLVIGGSRNDTVSAGRRHAENATFVDPPEVAGWLLANRAAAARRRRGSTARVRSGGRRGACGAS